MKRWLISLLMLSFPVMAAGFKALPPRPAPTLPFSLLSGAPLDFGMLRGQVVLVNFWASWCPPCRYGTTDQIHRGAR